MSGTIDQPANTWQEIEFESYLLSISFLQQSGPEFIFVGRVHVNQSAI